MTFSLILTLGFNRAAKDDLSGKCEAIQKRLALLRQARVTKALCMLLDESAHSED